MKRTSFFTIMVLAGALVFGGNATAADDIKTLTVLDSPWIFRSNFGGLSVEREIRTDVEDDFFAIYLNVNQMPTSVVFNEGKYNLKISMPQTMAFKGAYDIVPIDNYTVEYHEIEITEDDTSITIDRQADINCQEGYAFYKIYEGSKCVYSWFSGFSDGKIDMHGYIFTDEEGVDTSLLSFEIYGIIETGNYDVSDFTALDVEHNIDDTTYRGSYAVKTPDTCMGLVSVQVVCGDEVVGTSRTWIDNGTEATGSINIYDVDTEKVDDFEYRVYSFIPADYEIAEGDVVFDGTYEYPQWTFEEIYEKISTGNAISDITIMDNGKTMKVDTNSSDASTWDDAFEKDEKQMGYLKYVNGCLGLPEVLYEKMRMTPSGSGMYEETYENMKVTWTYTAGHGFEVLYEKIG